MRTGFAVPQLGTLFPIPNASRSLKLSLILSLTLWFAVGATFAATQPVLTPAKRTSFAPAVKTTAPQPVKTASVVPVTTPEGVLVHHPLKGPPVTHGNNQGEIEILREAYRILERGDHDYQGHRLEAMKQIEAAAKILGGNLRGDGHAREPQPLSNSQLHQAQGLLEQLKPTLAGRKQTRALEHVNAALRQLSTALTFS